MSTPLTGRKVLAIAAGAFGVIIAVNVAMAFFAVSSFPGTEVENGYVASQHFEAERTAQAALGWIAEADYDGARLIVTVRDRAGAPLTLPSLALEVGRPTLKASAVETAAVGASHAAPMALDPGLWRIDVAAEAPEGRFRQTLILRVGS